jgi:hypothetical protein
MRELGAAKSGLIRPSRVGPTLDPGAKPPSTSEEFSCREGREMNPPTVIAWRELPGSVMVEASDW